MTTLGIHLAMSLYEQSLWNTQGLLHDYGNFMPLPKLFPRPHADLLSCLRHLQVTPKYSKQNAFFKDKSAQSPTPNMKHLPAPRAYHLQRAPCNLMTSRARTFWFLHSLRPSARRFAFNQCTVRRKRHKKAALLSGPVGMASCKCIFKRRHHPSMAFRSGLHLGC